MICQRVFHQQSDSSQMTHWSTWQLHLRRTPRSYSQISIILQTGKTNGWWNVIRNFNVLTITKNHRVIKKDYILHGRRLELILFAKYLGVTLIRYEVDKICHKHQRPIVPSASSDVTLTSTTITSRRRRLSHLSDQQASMLVQLRTHTRKRTYRRKRWYSGEMCGLYKTDIFTPRL